MDDGIRIEKMENAWMDLNGIASEMRIERDDHANTKELEAILTILSNLIIRMK